MSERIARTKLETGPARATIASRHLALFSSTDKGMVTPPTAKSRTLDGLSSKDWNAATCARFVYEHGAQQDDASRGDVPRRQVQLPALVEQVAEQGQDRDVHLDPRVSSGVEDEGFSRRLLRRRRFLFGRQQDGRCLLLFPLSLREGSSRCRRDERLERR